MSYDEIIEKLKDSRSYASELMRELSAEHSLSIECDFEQLVELIQQRLIYDDDYDDSMDGDHESALASAGWGTDEDYGGGLDYL